MQWARDRTVFSYENAYFRPPYNFLFDCSDRLQIHLMTMVIQRTPPF
jgi:hypothetical protein